MRENEEKMAPLTQFRIKYQEAGGKKLAMLFSTDLAGGEHCGREDCHPCRRDEKRPNCKQRSILYELKCLLCNPVCDKPSNPRGDNPPQSRQGIYYGESSRSLHERTLEHIKDAKNFDEGSHIVKHWMITHPTAMERPTFQFSIVSSYRDCLSRQVGEAMRILYTRDQILNSKNEYLSNNITRITVDGDKLERRRKDFEEAKEEADEKEAFERFKLLKKRCEKRQRPEKHCPEDHLQFAPRNKRMRLSSLGDDDTDLDLGLWLCQAEARCNRVGWLKERIESEKLEMLRRLDEYRASPPNYDSEPEGWRDNTNKKVGGVEGGKVNQPTHPPSPPKANIKISEDPLPDGLKEVVPTSNGPTRNQMRTMNPKPYNLLGLVGWWRRHEKLEEAFLRSPSTSRKPHIPSLRKFFTQCTGNITNITGVTEVKKTSSTALCLDRTPTNIHAKNLKRKSEIVDGEILGSPLKKQKSNFSATLQFWAGKQSSTEQHHVSLSSEAATNPGSVQKNV